MWEGREERVCREEGCWWDVWGSSAEEGLEPEVEDKEEEDEVEELELGAEVGGKYCLFMRSRSRDGWWECRGVRSFSASWIGERTEWWIEVGRRG